MRMPALHIAVLALLFHGCLLVRTTEHRITLTGEGGGEALLRLVDIRSDAETDSGRGLDYAELGDILADSTLRGFVTPGRNVTGQRLQLRGDTLIAEVAYRFDTVEAVEGLSLQRGVYAVTVASHRELVGTNGSVETLRDGSLRITWPLDARTLHYTVSERTTDTGVSLAPWHRAAVGDTVR